MALPPERIRIKRRREDEPVETLYIQSDTHQHKRRFTDYVFQRVARTGDSTGGDAEGASTGATGLVPKHNRAVSTGGGGSGGSPGILKNSFGVPIVRTPAATDQLRTKRQRADVQTQQQQVQKENASPKKVVAGSPPTPSSSTPRKIISPSKRPSGSGAAYKAGAYSSLRSFHITVPTAVDEEDPSGVLHRVSGGIQKRRGTRPFNTRPVIVEKSPKKSLAAKATSILAGATATQDASARLNAAFAAAQKDGSTSLSSSPVDEREGSKPVTGTSPRKRHVISDAEKKWRAQEKESRYADRFHQSRELLKKHRKAESAYEDPSKWNVDSEQLADELSQIALEFTNYTERPADFVPVEPNPLATAATPAIPYRPEDRLSDRRPLKYQPRLPKGQRKASGGAKGGMRFDGSSESPPEMDTMDVDRVVSGIRDMEVRKDNQSAIQHETTNEREKPAVLLSPSQGNTADTEMDNSDSGYVYDEFIRRGINEVTQDSRMVHIRDGKWHGGQEEIPKDIGVVVITKEDAHYWDAFSEAKDEDKTWDTEDEDSNAEDNPANEYPDEDLDFDDEYNDANAIYRRFRSNASDDEEYDLNDEYGYPTYKGGDSDDFDDSDN